MADAEPLPSWRSGAARDDLLRFLAEVGDVPVEQRVAVFDNDGTLWCERPSYIQVDFFVDALRRAASADTSVAERPEFAAVLEQDEAAMASLGLTRIALALAGLFEGIEPDEFTQKVRDFLGSATHQTLGRPLADLTYQPMIELIDELRRAGFGVFICTGGGTEFVRAVSQELYGVPPEGVVGSLVGYELVERAGGPTVVRTTTLNGPANEGAAKVLGIQQHLGRRPILAGGNSGGDTDMLRYACAGDGPRLGLLVDHDDAAREFAYVSEAALAGDDEPITSVADREGWTVASMRDDWNTVFG